MNKFVIYTAIVGEYDIIHQPQALDDRFDYIIFSNDIKENQIGVWQIRDIPYENKDKTKIARWVKTHPEEILPEYEASVWMDGAFVIKTAFVYGRVLELFENSIVVSSMWHNQRDCAYDEAVEVVVLGLEHENVAFDWMHYMAKEKYPKHNGLFEKNVLYRNHGASDVKQLDSLWWNCINHYSRRDQLSFNYSLWKTNLECPYFFKPKENARNSKHILCVTNHIGTASKWRMVTRNKKDDVFYFYYSEYKDGIVDYYRIKRIYNIASRSLFPQLTVKLFGLFYRLLNVLKPLMRKEATNKS